MKVLSPLKLYDKFNGSPSEIRRAFAAAGEPVPSPVAISLWKYRGSIPSHWAGSLIYVLAAHGINPLDILEDLDLSEGD